MPAFLWTQKEDIGPSPRHGHAMCYDPARQRTLLYGGAADAPLGDSWTWTGQLWTQVADTGPSPRFDHAMCFDGARSAALLFGGKAGAALRSDTWSWNGEYWTQVEDTGPSGRCGHGMAFDPGRSRVVLFGGNAAGMTRDTWEWDGESWTQVEDSGPSPRGYHGMAYDLVRQKTLLFGGEGDDGTGLADTWEWDGNAWTQIEDIGPPACTRLALASTDVELVLFGGVSSSSAGNPPPTLFDDSWALAGSQWTQRQDMGPAGRWGHAMAFDTQRRTVVMFGGHASVDFDNVQGLRRDTWEHAETGASPVVPPPPDGSQPSIVELMLDPTTSSIGQLVYAHVTLNQAAIDGTVLQLFWAPQSAIDMSDPNNIQIVDPSALQPLAQFAIPPGNIQFSVQFETPPINETIAIVATSDGMTAQFALLSIV